MPISEKNFLFCWQKEKSSIYIILLSSFSSFILNKISEFDKQKQNNYIYFFFPNAINIWIRFIESNQ